MNQPPSGGCVLKPFAADWLLLPVVQPPSGGCVLKQRVCRDFVAVNIQPPSGGCVLKPKRRMAQGRYAEPAAFRRLCVETCIPAK